MGLKKKRNILAASICVGGGFLLYQVYIFLKISSGDTSGRQIRAGDPLHMREILPVRSIEDVNINSDGVIRGVLISKMPHYRSDSNYEFKCVTTEQRIPFDQVNDGYCDCEDQSDEPSTAACPVGFFYCDNQHRRMAELANVVPSSRVNDGICDCCDGSDEWLWPPHKKLLTQGSAQLRRYFSDHCPNICYTGPSL